MRKRCGLGRMGPASVRAQPNGSQANPPAGESNWANGTGVGPRLIGPTRLPCDSPASAPWSVLRRSSLRHERETMRGMQSTSRLCRA